MKSPWRQAGQLTSAGCGRVQYNIAPMCLHSCSRFACPTPAFVVVDGQVATKSTEKRATLQLQLQLQHPRMISAVPVICRRVR